MLEKIGIYVCPEKGCPAIGKKSGLQCPKHKRDMRRKVYKAQSILDDVEDLAREIHKAFSGSKK